MAVYIMKLAFAVSALAMWLALSGCSTAVIQAQPVKQQAPPIPGSPAARCVFAGANSTPNQLSRVYALIDVAELLALSSHHKKMTSIAFKRAQKAVFLITDVVPRYDAISRLAAAYIQAGRLDRATPLVAQLPDASTRVNHLIQMAELLAKNGQVDRASDRLRESLDEFDDIESLDQRASALERVALLYRDGGSEKGELYTLKRWFEVVQRSPKASRSRQVPERLARLARLGMRPEVLSYASQLSDRVLRERALNNIWGDIALIDPSFVSKITVPVQQVRAYVAINKPELAAKSADRILDDVLRVRAFVQVAHLFHQLNNDSRSQDMLASVMNSITPDSTAYAIAKVCHAAALQLILLGGEWTTRQPAEQLLHRALTTSQTIRNQAERAAILVEIARTYRFGGAPQAGYLAEKMALKALSKMAASGRKATLISEFMRGGLRDGVRIKLASQLTPQLWSLVKSLSVTMHYQRLASQFALYCAHLGQTALAVAAIAVVKDRREQLQLLSRLVDQTPALSPTLNALCPPDKQ